MYIKWIVCEVEEKNKNDFSIFQQKWKNFENIPGFIAQIGGWKSKNSTEACILGIWENKESLDYFMKNIHDDIFENNKQIETYSSIKVNHFHSDIDIGGDETNFKKAIEKSKILRVAECIVKNEKINHFKDVQYSIWNIGMKNAGGMLCGKLSIHESIVNNYLLTTFWDSQYKHERYVQNHLPELKESSNINDDLEEVKGKVIVLEKYWTVIS